MVRSGRSAAHEGLSKPETPPKPRSGKLVIVESPAKARTIGRFLGRGYRVMASVGHIRDLLRSQLSVDVDNNFEPRYRVPNEKRAIVKELTAAVSRAETVYLATDLDREGEAIAWHLMETAGIEPERVRRVVFHEITQDAISEAFSKPTEINMDLVDAQQARRILDRLVGYKISPLLWMRVRNRLTAGRVQSVAVRLVVDREREIEAFEPQEYWSLEAELAQRLESCRERHTFVARLVRIDGAAVNITSEAAISPILDDLEDGYFQVVKVRTGQRRRSPKAPFTTSTLQQTAFTRFKFRTQRTMRVAQQLYEGVELGDGEPVGLITYMRTDSVAVAEQAQKEARDWIEKSFGAAYLPAEAPQYKSGTRKAQEAHEAIRPTSVQRSPKSIKGQLSRDQYRLYQLIWSRFVASQMAPAIFETQSVNIAAGSDEEITPYLFRASGSQLAFPGFLAVYEETEKENDTTLPSLIEGEILELQRLIPEQHFTQPPPRYSEAKLVKALEERGIGRPSTYAPTISTILQRGYVETDESGRLLIPTEMGTLVTDLLVEHFPTVLSYSFTAEMEDELDRIATGDAEWVPVLRRFYTPFAEQLDTAEEKMPEIKLGDQPVGRDCPQCGTPLILKWGRFGKFIACQDYPTCKYTEPWLDKIGVPCPECGGDLVRKRTRKGRTFFGCAAYPDCDFSSWKRPLAAACPSCGGMLVVQNKRQASCIRCEERLDLADVAVETSKD
jgi:DNA topoisomerase-1